MVSKDSSIAVYRQIIDYFELEIVSGRLKAGERIDSIRSLAVEFKVNPNTIQKSLNQLEEKNLIYTDGTNGKFISDNKEAIDKLREEKGRQLGKTVADQAYKMGLTLEATIHLIKTEWKEIEDGE